MTPPNQQSHKNSQPDGAERRRRFAHRMRNWKQYIPHALAVVAFLGFIDATLLTVDHYTALSLPCGVSSGCGVVTSSRYSQIFGIPVSLGGMAYYLTVFLGIMLYFETKNTRLLRALSLFTIVGLIASSWFMFAMIVLIGALCKYCIASAASSTTLFLLGMLWIRTSSPAPLPIAAHEAQRET